MVSDKLGDAASEARAAQLEHAFFNKLFEDVVKVNWEFECAARALLRIQERRRGQPGCFCRLLMSMCRVQAPQSAPSTKPSTKVLV